jgi:hypothetical protein
MNCISGSNLTKLNYGRDLLQHNITAVTSNQNLYVFHSNVTIIMADYIFKSILQCN